MPALNFKPRFAPLVEAGMKQTTFRRHGKRTIKRGDTLYLNTGMRTKRCRRLKTVVCTDAYDVEIRQDQMVVMTDDGPVTINHDTGLDGVALYDGFASWDELVGFFRDLYGIPFTGRWILWQS